MRDGFRVAACVVLLLALASLGAGWKHYQEIRTQRGGTAGHARAVGESAEEESALGGPLRRLRLQTYQPTGLVDTGIDPLSACRRGSRRIVRTSSATGRHRIGRRSSGSATSAALRCQLLLPLFIMLIAFPHLREA